MPEQGTGRITTLVAIGSSILTIVLTMYNTYTKAQIDAADSYVKQRQLELDAKLKERSANLEESKERTGRYTFVHTLFPDLLDKETSKKELTINLIRLALTEEEGTKLFTGFSKSSNEQLQSAGNTAITIIQKEKTSSQTALEKEREGFQNLIDGKLDQSILAFEAAESAYPSYHQVYELARLIKSRKQALSDPATKKAVLTEIITSYSYGAPSDLLAQLRAMASQ